MFAPSPPNPLSHSGERGSKNVDFGSPLRAGERMFSVPVVGASIALLFCVHMLSLLRDGGDRLLVRSIRD